MLFRSSGGAAESAAVGPYSVSPSAAVFSSGSASNYTISYSDGTLTVTPASLTITANSFNKVYGVAYPFAGTEFTTTPLSLPNSDAVGSVTLASGGAAASAAVGPYSVSPSAAVFSSGSASNYTISYSDGTLTVTPASLTITANSFNKVYGVAYPFAGTEFTTTPLSLPNSDAVGSVTLASGGAAASAAVGPYSVSPSAAVFSSGSASNYTISYSDGTLTVTPASLTITANSFNKVYGVAYPFAGTEFTTTPLSLPNSDAVGSVTLASGGAAASAAVGPYSVSPSAAVFSSGSASNYTISYSDGTLTVTPAFITATAGSGGPTVYDNMTKIPSACSITVQTGTNFDGLTCNNDPSPVGPAPGNHPITPSVVGTNQSNYNITSVNGIYTITSGTILGSVTYAIPQPVPSGSPTPTPKPVPNVALTAPGGSLPTIVGTTSLSGNYLLSNYDSMVGPISSSFFGAGSYTVTPTRASQPCIDLTPGNPSQNGVDVQDASLVSQAVVGLVTLSPTQIEAGKVSGTPTLSAFDAALIARKTVGLCTSPTNLSGQWRFIPNPITAPNGTASGSSLLYSTVATTYPGENYDAYMMGDVNGDWSPTSSFQRPDVNPETAARVSVPNLSTQPGALVTVPVRIENLNGAAVSSYQFDINYNPAVVNPDELAADLAGTLSSGLNVVFNVLQPGLLKVAVYGAVPVTGDGVYMNLRFTANGTMGTNSPLAISGFRFNDGSVGAITQDGSLTVNSGETRTIRGRLATPQGQGLRNATVILTDSEGGRVTTVTSSFGRFEFGGVVLGRTYTVTAASKRFRFAPQIVSVVDGLAELEMTAQE